MHHIRTQSTTLHMQAHWLVPFYKQKEQEKKQHNRYEQDYNIKLFGEVTQQQKIFGEVITAAWKKRCLCLRVNAKRLGNWSK
jgi:hypothetical protein